MAFGTPRQRWLLSPLPAPAAGDPVSVCSFLHAGRVFNSQLGINVSDFCVSSAFLALAVQCVRVTFTTPSLFPAFLPR